MTVGFRKIAAPAMDATRVTLRVLKGADNSIIGRVSTLAYGAAGLEVMSTEGDDPPIGVALKLASELAAFKEQDVDVLDDLGLWQDAWGKLT